MGVAVGADGTVQIADSSRIASSAWKVDTSGRISTLGM